MLWDAQQQKLADMKIPKLYVQAEDTVMIYSKKSENQVQWWLKIEGGDVWRRTCVEDRNSGLHPPPSVSSLFLPKGCVYERVCVSLCVCVCVCVCVHVLSQPALTQVREMQWESFKTDKQAKRLMFSMQIDSGKTNRTD